MGFWSLAALTTVLLVGCAEPQPASPSAAPTPNVQATVEAAIATALSSPTPAPTPDIEATVQARVRAELQDARPPPDAAPVPTPHPSVPAPRTGAPDPILAVVTNVVDGDTVDIRFEDGSTDRVRLLGIDTPETFSTNEPGEYGAITDTACLNDWGVLASELTSLLERKSVAIEKDSAAGERGSFGRLLAYVSYEGRDWNAALVEGGFARVSTEGTSSREQQYLLLEAEARAQAAGLWSCGSAAQADSLPLPDRSGAGGSVVIECIFYDGVVPRSEADEYVQIANLGNSDANIDGWRITDVADGSPSLFFPELVRRPGDRIRVYTNQRHDEWGGLGFGYGRAVWNNSSPDVAALFDSAGTEVSRKSYPPGC